MSHKTSSKSNLLAPGNISTPKVSQEKKNSSNGEVKQGTQICIHRTLMESSVDLIFLKDLEGKYIEVNSEFCRFVGVSHTDIIGKQVGMFFDEEQQQKIEKSDQMVLATNEPQVTELDFYKDDRRYILETIKSPLKGKKGETVGFFGISRDITQRKLSEEALRTSQHLLKQSEKQSRSGSFEFDSKKQTLFCSTQLLLNLGFPKEQKKISYQQFLERINEAERKIFDDELKRATLEKLDFFMEHRCTKLNNQKVIQCKTLIVPDETGREGIFFGIVTDATRDRQVRKSILDIQEEERKLIASNLHDSLGQKLVASKMFLNEIDPKNTEMLERASKLIDQSIDEIRSLSRNLSLNTIQGQGLKASIEDVISTIPQSTHVEFLLNFDESELSDDLSTQLYRIVQESLTNILKYANAGLVKILIRRESEFLDMVICDDGVGFNADIDHQGNGLRNIRERVARCSGHVEIQSSKEGTKIKIKVPVK